MCLTENTAQVLSMEKIFLFELCVFFCLQQEQCIYDQKSIKHQIKSNSEKSKSRNILQNNLPVLFKSHKRQERLWKCHGGKFPFVLHPASLNVNILHNHGTIIKTRTLALVQYYQGLRWEDEGDSAPVLFNNSNPIFEHHTNFCQESL